MSLQGEAGGFKDGEGRGWFETVVLVVAHSVQDSDRLQHSEQVVDPLRGDREHKAAATAQNPHARGGKGGQIPLRDVLNNGQAADQVERLAGRELGGKRTLDVQIFGGARRHGIQVDPDSAAQAVVQDAEKHTIGAGDIQDARALCDVGHDPADSLPLQPVIKPLHSNSGMLWRPAPYHACVPTPFVRVLKRPLLWWAIAGAMFVHDIVGNLLTTQRPDAASVIQAGYRWLHDPSAIYADTAAHLARTGLVPVTGLIRPPAAAMLAAPFTVLPGSWQVPAWTVADALAVLIGLLIVQCYIAHSSLERAVFWAVALYCPPLYAEINAGQIGGFVLLPACAALITLRRRPGLSGALAAAAASLKLYPALMVLGARLRWRQFVIGAMPAGLLITLVACIPLGLDGTWQYVTGVLLPSLRAPNPDCAQTSVATLFGRSIGGDPYPIINSGGGITTLESPLHLAGLAFIFTLLTLGAAVLAAIVAERASGWNPAYGMALGLALGALLPGELNPYQYLPLLPLVLMVIVIEVRHGRWMHLTAIALGMLFWLRQPCLLPFPNLWTVGALILFAVCVIAARDFRAKESRPV